MALRVGGTISGHSSVHAEVDGSHHGYRIDGNGPDEKLVYLRATEACLFTVLVRLECIGMYPGDDVWGRREVKICIVPLVCILCLVSRLMRGCANITRMLRSFLVVMNILGTIIQPPYKKT
ncbi:unnamed protein product [Ectocarpus fasciculatus]